MYIYMCILYTYIYIYIYIYAYVLHKITQNYKKVPCSRSRSENANIYGIEIA